MQNWSETYRGTVPPWECDVTEHFTIAYYFDRLEEAERNLADLLGLAELLRAGGFARRLNVRIGYLSQWKRRLPSLRRSRQHSFGIPVAKPLRCLFKPLIQGLRQIPNGPGRRPVTMHKPGA